MSYLTFDRRGGRYLVGAGDFEGSVTGAAGTRYFEPDGAAFCHWHTSCLFNSQRTCREAVFKKMTALAGSESEP